MGEQDVTTAKSAEGLRDFMRRLLRDVQAVEHMLTNGCFETGRSRVGAEQELFLVDKARRPAPVVQCILDELGDEHFTTEIALFNLEFNLDPFEFGGDCLRRLEKQIEDFLHKTRVAAATCEAEPVMVGILPTLRHEDLGLDSMVPLPRYAALNDAMNRLRGGPFRFRIKGPDELVITHDNVMLESCNTSFQVHFQVDPDRFARHYNIAQLVAAPMMAAAVNSPLLFGRRLWKETRIALFQQSVDTRGEDLMGERELKPRVSFGTQWVRESALEIFREDIARFRVLLATGKDEDPFEALEAGRAPQLHALRLHNGTVYRWNRACYGISDGKPHLRIENRILPSGPTAMDEVANAAFWFGLMRGLNDRVGDFTETMDFDDARANLLAACRLGLRAQFRWLDGENWTAKELICDKLLPVAQAGLEASNIDASDVSRYLGLVHDRVTCGMTGARWQLDSLTRMKDDGNLAERLAALTSAIIERQRGGEPGHTWPLASIRESESWKDHYARVEAFMTKDIFTVHEDELVDLAANVMDWEHIRHVPVEDTDHRLVGLVTHRALLRFFGQKKDDRAVSVKEIMQRDPITVSPETLTLDAIQLMKERRISCLPVVRDGRLVGLLSEHDLIPVAARLLEERLRE